MDTRQAILDASYEILGSGGLENLHARTVAAQLGINHATVHYHFPSRRDLVRALADHLAEKFRSDREKVLGAASTAKVSLEAEVALYEAYCRPQSRFFRVWVSLFVASQVDDEVRAKLREASIQWSQSLSESMARARAEGVGLGNSPLADPYLFTSTMLGLGLMAHLFGEQNQNTEQFDRIVADLEADRP